MQICRQDQKHVGEIWEVTTLIKMKYKKKNFSLNTDLTFPPIMTVLGTNGALGFFLMRLYITIIWRQFSSCLLYSCILLTWMSNIDAGLTFTPVSFVKYSASFSLFSYNTKFQNKFLSLNTEFFYWNKLRNVKDSVITCLILCTVRMKEASVANFFNSLSSSKWVTHLSPIR